MKTSDDKAKDELLAQSPRKVRINKDEALKLAVQRITEIIPAVERLFAAHNQAAEAHNRLKARVDELERRLNGGAP